MWFRYCAGNLGTVQTIFLKGSESQDRYFRIDSHNFNFFSNATTCPLRLRGLPPPRLWLKCNQLLRLGRPVGAVTLSRWEWWWNEWWIWGASGGGGAALNLISTNYPDHGHHGRLPLSRKNAHGRAGNQPGTSWLVVRGSDHQATRLVTV